jgi:hypothetical protein
MSMKKIERSLKHFSFNGGLHLAYQQLTRNDVELLQSLPKIAGQRRERNISIESDGCSGRYAMQSLGWDGFISTALASSWMRKQHIAGTESLLARITCVGFVWHEHVGWCLSHKIVNGPLR